MAIGCPDAVGGCIHALTRTHNVNGFALGITSNYPISYCLKTHVKEGGEISKSVFTD